MSLESLMAIRCPNCQGADVKAHTQYKLQTGETRTIYVYPACDQDFSQTYATALAGLRTPLSRIQMILDALNDGMGVNAVCRTFHVSKTTLADLGHTAGPVDRNAAGVCAQPPLFTASRGRG